MGFTAKVRIELALLLFTFNCLILLPEGKGAKVHIVKQKSEAPVASSSSPPQVKVKSSPANRPISPASFATPPQPSKVEATNRNMTSTSIAQEPFPFLMPEECDDASCLQECLMGSFVDAGPDSMRFSFAACNNGTCQCTYQSVCQPERCYNTCTKKYQEKLNGSTCMQNQCYCVHSNGAPEFTDGSHLTLGSQNESPAGGNN
ncbi:unnamed protein product [Ixodes persulcatus]